jgi:arylsulfatase A-like enzyme
MPIWQIYERLLMATGPRIAAQRPNVIWIFGDQHRAQALGVAGDPNVHTPNVDRLATDGLYCPQAVGGFPLSCPYRGSLLSGRYPHEAVPGHEYPLDPALPTVAQPFGEAGYHTAYFGKWHVDGWHERDGRAGLHIVPRERRGGFDQWLGYENNNAQWDCHVHGHDAQGNEIPLYRLPYYETDALTDLLIDFIDERALPVEGDQATADQSADASPFFAVLSVQPPHDPYVAPEPWMARHTPGEIQLRPNVPDVRRITEKARRELAGYYAMIENLDWNLGRVIEALREAGLHDNTHIIFFSDHGDMHGSHGQFRKTSALEESLRVPMIFGGGRRYELKNGISDAPINHVDLAPTSLGLCGIDVPDWMVGHDWSARRIKGRQPATDEPDSAYCQVVKPTGHGHSVDRPWRGLVSRDGWKYVCLEGQPWYLFNLNEDPYEQANHAHNTIYRSERKRLHDRLNQWIAQTGDSFAMPEL